jgi:hypothetical protein
MVDMDTHFNCDTCVMRFKDMPLADIKAVFARDGGFNIGGLAGEAQESDHPWRMRWARACDEAKVLWWRIWITRYWRRTR